MLGMDCTVALLRGGFSDGLPASMQGRRGVLMVGMQYAAIDAGTLAVDGSQYRWLHRDSSLDAFANDAGRPVHEIITALGHASARA